jgi:hypothetical protein
MNNHASEEQRRQLVAEFRHSVVAELANPYLNHGELISSIREKANRTYEIPFSRKTTITEGCIKKWLALYRRYGKAGLLPKVRADKGSSRVLPEPGAGRIPGVSHRSPRAHRTGGIPHPLRQRDDTDGNLIFITIPAGTIGGTGAGTTTHRKGA